MPDIVAEVFSLLQQAGRETGTQLPPGASDVEIADFERDFQMCLPEALKSWLRISNGPRLGPGGLYGITEGDEDTKRAITIDQVIDLYPHWRDLQWIPVASDGCGNDYVMSVKSKGNPVMFVETCSAPDVAAYAVASDLWHFLRFLLKREMGERSWPFRDRVKVCESDPLLKDVTCAPLPWDVADTP